MASGQLPGIHQKGSVASKFAGPKPHGLPFLGCDVKAYHKLHAKPKSKLEALQVMWNSLVQEPLNKVVKNFTL